LFSSNDIVIQLSSLRVMLLISRITIISAGRLNSAYIFMILINFMHRKNFDSIIKKKTFCLYAAYRHQDHLIKSDCEWSNLPQETVTCRRQGWPLVTQVSRRCKWHWGFRAGDRAAVTEYELTRNVNYL